MVQNYREHLQNLEDLTNAYNYTTVDKWDGYAWQGFYMELERHLSELNWEYVPNPSGGFWGANWSFLKPQTNDFLELYLQFEEAKLCFKIGCYKKEIRSEMRDKCYAALIKCSEGIAPEIVKPDRFGAGTYMTIGVVKSEKIFGDGIVNIKEIENKLKRYQEILDKTKKEIESIL